MKKIIVLLITLITLLFVSPILVRAHAADENTQDVLEVKSTEITYELPHTGILPDHPLYFVKVARDSVVTFFTRDNLKRAEYMLLLSDKKIVMAQMLADKGKWELSLESMEESEEYVERIVKAVDLSEKIGSGPSEDFIRQLRTSNEKHEEIMENLIQIAPQGVQKDIQEVIQLNLEHYEMLKKL